MSGCLKNFLAAVGCLTLLAVGGGAGWVFRDQVTGLYRSLVHGTESAPTIMDRSTGRPSAGGLRSALGKQAAMGRRGGPGSATFTADEAASMIEAGLDPAARTALESLRVRLEPDRLTLEGAIVTDLLGRALLGSFAGLLAGREPVSVSGPVRVIRLGRLAWVPDSFVVRAFPFPRRSVPRLVDRLTRGSDGSVWIDVPESIGEVRIRPDGMTLFRTR